jgi:hypothetical protein
MQRLSAAGVQSASVKKKLFNELVESIKEAGRIHRRATEPSRLFVFEPQDVAAIRQKPLFGSAVRPRQDQTG